jgi:predicted pyridoxine 5'-phosphate oxidase superfamily flavin-nucleotide-binding protein
MSANREEYMESWQEGFDNRFTQQFGLPIERVATKIQEVLTEAVRDYISLSPFLVMATSSKGGGCDASPKGGKPGFVRILDQNHLLVPDVAGNKLFQSYLNMDENPYVGLLFFIPGRTDMARVNGRIIMVDRDELDRWEVENEMYYSEGNRGVQQGVVVEVEEAYTHCPRALTYSKLWDTGTIADGRATAPSAAASPAPAQPVQAAR